MMVRRRSSQVARGPFQADACLDRSCGAFTLTYCEVVDVEACVPRMKLMIDSR